MRQVKTESMTVAEANAAVGVDMEAAFWEALVRFIAYPEVIRRFAQGGLQSRGP